MPSFRPYTTRCITLRGRHLHLYAWGAEQPDPAATLFCLHGWGDLGASFQFVVDALPQDWCILAPDWRGFGRSAHNDGPYWFPDYLADLDALLEALSPNRPATLVGHSLGGIVASLYAGIRPERVAHLALLEGLVLWSEAPERAPERCAGWLDAVRGEDKPFPRFRSYASPEAFAARLQRDNPRLTSERAEFIARHALTRDADGRLSVSADPRHRWPAATLFPLDEAMACWRRVRAPTLSLLGADSKLPAPGHLDAAALAARHACFSQLRTARLDNCGHNLHHDRPDAVAAHLQALLAP